VQALATNKLQGSFGTMTASVSLWRRGLVGPLPVTAPFLIAGASSAVGALCLQGLSTDASRVLVPVMLLGITAYFVLAPDMTADRRPRLGLRSYYSLIVPATGFYDGFFGPGAGAFFVAGGVHCRGYRLVTATARAKVLNFATNLGALLVFIRGEQIVWRAGAVMAVGQVLGAYLGSTAVARGGARLIRPLTVTMCLSLLVQYLWRNRGLYL
jgi:uncharacterized membrane protein YfcA